MNWQDQGDNRLLTKVQVAEFFQVTVRTIDAWMRAGKIPYFRISRTVRFRLKAVLGHLNESHRIH